METLIELLPIIIPILLIELSIRVYCIVDIHKEHRKVLLLNKTGWTLIVLIVTLGWVVYLLAGREQ